MCNMPVVFHSTYNFIILNCARYHHINHSSMGKFEYTSLGNNVKGNI